MLQNLFALVLIAGVISGFFYWLIKSNQNLHREKYEDELAETEALKRANKAADEVLAKPLGTDDEWLADQRRMHHENDRGETQKG